MLLRLMVASSVLYGANFIPNAILNLGIDYSAQHGLVLDSDGNFYVAGAANNHAMVVKVSPSGRILYSKAFGGSGNDSPAAIAVDASGAAYIAGITNSPDFPIVNGFSSSTPTDRNVPFLTKLSPDGSTIVYSTLIAAAGVAAVAVDSAGNAYVTGDTYAKGFTATPGAFQTTGTDNPAFIAKIAADGNRLLWATFLSGNGIACATLPGVTCPFSTPGFHFLAVEHDIGRAIAVDSDGNVYVAGSTNSAGFPVTAGALQMQYADPHGTASQGFVAKLSADGSSLLYSTYIGTPDGEDLFALAVDSQGSAIVGGQTRSSAFPTTPGALQPAAGKFGGGFVAKLDPQGTSLVYATYLGNGMVTGIATGGSGNAYMTGVADAPFPTTPGTIEATSNSDGSPRATFFTELDPGGAVLYSTLLPYGSAAQGIAANDQAVAVLGTAVLTTFGRGDAMQPAAFALQNVAGPSVIGRVAPGELVRIYGVNLDSNLPITFDGVQAPVLASGGNRVDIQVPFEISGRSTTALEISGSSQALSLEVTTADPAIYSASGFNTAELVNPDATLNALDHTAALGGEVAIFATGAGRWANGLATGAIEPGPRLAQIPISVLVGQQPYTKQYEAVVVYAGSSPTRSNGIVQVNFILPDTPDFFVSPDSGTGVAWIKLRIGSQESPPLAIITGRP